MSGARTRAVGAGLPVLPEDLSALVGAVSKRTRLWRSERADVERELASHFADGLERGATVGELRDAFGDPKAAARLIRRAKLRNRPLWWRVSAGAFTGFVRLFLATLALLFAVYAVLFVMFNLSEPTLKRNYLAELNEPILAVPEQDRAWPIYLDAIRAVDSGALRQARSSDPERAAWIFAPTREEAIAVVNERQEGIDLIRAAASKPALGYILSTRVDPALLDALGVEPDPPELEPAAENPYVIGILLPYLSELKQMARILWVDAHAAMDAADGSRFESDIVAMLGIAEHSRECPFLISDLVALSIADLALRTMQECLAAAPEQLDDDAWTRLVHAAAGFPKGGGRIMRLSGERMGFDDFLQRFYTDDGEGGGHPTVEGIRLLSTVSSGLDNTQLYPGSERFLGPVSIAAMAGREEMRREYDRLIALALAESEPPLWERGASRLDEEVEALGAGFLAEQRYGIIYLLMPALSRALLNDEYHRMRQDATAAAVACELFRRRTGEWPTSWDELVPDLLPSPPLDRFVGRPMGLRIIDGLPRIYGVGTDLDDDGGEWVLDHAGRVLNERSQRWRAAEQVEAMRRTAGADRIPDGDWILFPPPPPDPPRQEFEME